MAFLSQALAFFGFSGLVRKRGTQYPVPQYYSIPAAKSVTFDSAMQVSAFWACVRLLAETVAGLPMEIVRLDGNRRTVVDDHPLWRVMTLQPNPYQTKIEFYETLMLNLCCWGNAYARIVRNGAGQVVGLVPLMSAQVETILLEDGSIVHKYNRDEGLEIIAAQNMWHIKLFGNGVIGLSPLGYARNSLGIAQAGEDRVTSIFKNGAKPTGLLMVDAALTKNQRSEIREAFRDLAEGNNDSLIVLDKFMKYESVSMSPQDIELLESRRFQMEDIARFMGVPSVLINDTQGSTVWGSGVQQIVDGFYKLNLRPYLERIELSARVHLLPIEEQRRYEFAFNFDSLLRADMKTRMEARQAAINSGQLTPNEARAEEGREPREGGDELLVNSTMVPISQAGARIQTGAPNGNQTTGV